MKKVYSVITTILLIILIAFAAALFLPRIFGVQPMAVLSGSMEPTFHVGSLVYVKEVEPNTIKEGDPITFKLSGDTVVTHRVVKVDDVNQTFTTKGDANEQEDGSGVPFSNVIGKALFSIPLLGYLAVYTSTKSGMIILFTIIAVVLILTFLPDLLFKEEDKDKKEKSKNKE